MNNNAILCSQSIYQALPIDIISSLLIGVLFVCMISGIEF